MFTSVDAGPLLVTFPIDGGVGVCPFDGFVEACPVDRTPNAIRKSSATEANRRLIRHVAILESTFMERSFNG